MVGRFNLCIKCCQLDNSLSYCILRSPSERALALETVSDHLPPPKPVLGLAACSCVVHLLNSGEHLIAMDDLYGGTKTYQKKVANANMGINTTYIDLTDPRKVCTLLQRDLAIFKTLHLWSQSKLKMTSHKYINFSNWFSWILQILNKLKLEIQILLTRRKVIDL